jgi:glucose/arabinose dehydrogenase
MPRLNPVLIASLAALMLSSAAASSAFADMKSFNVKGTQGTELTAKPLASFDSAWAMTFLPDGRALVSEKNGAIWLINKDGSKAGKISGGPTVTARGQGGMGDIIVHPEFATNGTVFLSYVERDPKKSRLSGAVVERAKLTLGASTGKLTKRERVWEQRPKVTGNGHYGHRLVIGPEGYLYISSGERQKFTPSQNMSMNLGKSIRLNQDGSAPKDNPFYIGDGSAADEIWTLGHRNPLGIAFDPKGRLWMQEMGPRHGDELNLIERSKNYGYPHVSNGDHYSGKKIPDHADIPIYEAPKVSWVPAISPGGLMFYTGKIFGDWKGDAFIGGLSSMALIRVEITEPKEGSRRGVTAAEAERYEWERRIREVEQGPDGAIYVLEDQEDGRLIKLTPKK